MMRCTTRTYHEYHNICLGTMLHFWRFLLLDVENNRIKPSCLLGVETENID